MTKENFEDKIPADPASEAAEEVSTDRRRVLGLLGLAATTAYVAPTLLSVNKAHASGGSGGGGRGGGGGGRGSGGRARAGGRGSGGRRSGKRYLLGNGNGVRRTFGRLFN